MTHDQIAMKNRLEVELMAIKQAIAYEDATIAAATQRRNQHKMSEAAIDAAIRRLEVPSPLQLTKTA